MDSQHRKPPSDDCPTTIPHPSLQRNTGETSSSPTRRQVTSGTLRTGFEAATNAAELATSERRTTTTDTGSDGTTYTLDPMDYPSRRTDPLITVTIRPTI